VGLAGEGGESEGFLLGEAGAQHSQLCTGTKKKKTEAYFAC